MSSPSYHPSVPVTAEQSARYEAKAHSQEVLLLRFLVKHMVGAFTCEQLELCKILPERTPHSSYIRALANLRRDGMIVSAGQVAGRYGRPVNAYTVTRRGVAQCPQ